ncbi:MAG: radical SAM protein [Candidatus Omnitrophota bacterium]|nr:B12-binding domain-containing radical SAM protein [Candidatus Omnitrophota bacterium]
MDPRKKSRSIVLISTDECITGTGVRTLSSCLLQAGFSSTIVFMQTFAPGDNGFHWNDLKEICSDACLIGISCMTHSVAKAIEVKQILERELPAPIIVGGAHASADPESLLNFFDLVCCGEGEDMLVTLAERICHGASYQDVAGLWIKQHNDIIRNQACPLQRDINDYPFPDYDISHQFILENNRLIPMKAQKSGSWHAEYIHFPIQGSRGCPHRCAYCSNQTLKERFPWRARVRHYSVDYIINHLKEICNHYPEIESFWFSDDTFFDKGFYELAEFVRMYPSAIHKPFLILISPWTFDEEKLKLALEAGMSEVIVGVQSGSEHTNRAIYDRPIATGKILEVARTLSRYRTIQIYYDFIGMNPFEREEDIVATIQLIKRLPPPFYLYHNSLAFYPGTKLYERAHAAGLHVRTRIKHTGSAVGYLILKEEALPHKLFHWIILLMEGDANDFRIGYVPRALVTDSCIAFYRFINQRLPLLANSAISILSFFVMYEPLRKVIRFSYIDGILCKMKSRYLRIH